MGVRIPRKKHRNFLVSAIYRGAKLLPMGKQRRFRFFLNLEWIFDRLAMESSYGHYRGGEHPARTFTRKCVLEGIRPSDTVLDLGCNQGFMSDYIAGKAARVVGVDYNAELIHKAKARYKRDNLSFVAGDAAEYLAGTALKFDVLILSHILEHIDEPKEFLLRFKDHFSRIYIELPDFDRYYLNHYRKDMGMDLIYSDEDHVIEFDRVELRALLDECGLVMRQGDHIFGVHRIWAENPKRQ